MHAYYLLLYSLLPYTLFLFIYIYISLYSLAHVLASEPPYLLTCYFLRYVAFWFD